MVIYHGQQTVKDFKSFYLSSTIDSISVLGLEKSSANLIPKNTVIIPTRMALGKVAINLVDLTINQDLKALFIKEPSKLLTLYLAYALMNKATELENQGSGATVKGVKLSTIQELEIVLPSVDM